MPVVPAPAGLARINKKGTHIMSSTPSSSARDPRAETLFLPPDNLDDNIKYMEWLNQCIRVLQTGAVCIHVGAASANAALRKVNRHLLIGGLTSTYRANMATKPVDNAAEACVVGVKYLYTAKTKFEAAFMPELEAAGYRPAGGEMKFKAR